MGDEPHHECGFALLRLLKPLEHYEEKYGTSFFGLNRMYLLMEKQRNRGQDGCGVASVKLDVPPGVKYMNCEKSMDKDPIKDVFERIQRKATDARSRAPAGRSRGKAGCVDPDWAKENVPFDGELFLGHVRYGTDADNSVDKCHPVLRESNWMTRSLLLAGNFNITNNEDLFASLVQIGQHPREVSDTVTLLEKIGHFVDKENNDLYVKYLAAGQAPRTCFSLIAENINVARILRRASMDWDGGYCIAGMFGHGDAFVLRDPCGIRPAFYLANDEVIVVASEAPLIQTVFEVPGDEVHPVPPGQALVIKRSGRWSLEPVLAPKELKQCSFERIYFSRGNDAGVYREREQLGRHLFSPLLRILEAEGDAMSNTVLSFIPNTSELSFNGLVKEAQDEVSRRRSALIADLQAHAGSDVKGGAHPELANMVVRTEKVVHKDAKIRTFIQEDSSREHLTVHAYDVHYGTVRAREDVLVALDDSIVRGNTLKNAIIRALDRLQPKRIVILSSAPQIRYPDVYGIDMAKLGDLAAFRAAITLLQERGMESVITEVYRACRSQLSKPLREGGFVNHVQRIYEPFTDEEISGKIVEQITPDNCNAKVSVLFNTVEALHESMPEFAGDWYFTGNYPTPGGAKVCCRAFALWMEGSSARCYGVNSAISIAQVSVLVVGHGGCDHAIAWKLSQSHEVDCVYVAPGNGGTTGHQTISGGLANAVGSQSHAPLVPVDVPVAAPAFREIADFCKEYKIALVVVGCEQLLLDGLADVLRLAGVPVFGPSHSAAQIVSSCHFSRAFLQQHGIPTVDLPRDEPSQEEWPRGREVSIVAFSDGSTFSLLPVAVQEHKWALDQNRGAFTDGMGSFSPSPLVDDDMLEAMEASVIQPVLQGLAEQDRPFIGCLHIELVLMASGPKVYQVHSCLGEPTAQTIMSLLDADVFEIFSTCATGCLKRRRLDVHRECSVVAIVMASEGYPGPCRRGHAISGLERALCVPDAHVFHTSTAVQEGALKGPQTSIARRKTSVPHCNQRIMTCGGRVFTVVALGSSLNEARERACVAARSIRFDGAWYREDIAALAALSPGNVIPKSPSNRRATKRSTMGNVLNGPACTDETSAKTREPRSGTMRAKACFEEISSGEVLVSSAHTVGTKLLIASHFASLDGIGIDLVALCVNDLASRGAKPLFFSEHVSADQMESNEAAQLVKGCSAGCRLAGCSLLDTQMAEFPETFVPRGVDFVGFAVGLALRNKPFPQPNLMSVGDVLIALPASGLHSTGFSLVRAVVSAAGLEYRQAAPFEPNLSLAEALLAPTRIYAQPLLSLVHAGLVHGAAPVASGGLERCLEGVLPPHLAAHLRADSWDFPASLRWLAGVGKIRCGELASTFNCGIGMLLVVSENNAESALTMLKQQHQERPLIVGELVKRTVGAPLLEIEGAEGSWLMLPELGVSLPFPEVLSSLRDPSAVTRKRVLVLAGKEEITPMQALIQAFAVPASSAFLAGVVTPYAGSPAAALAKMSGVRSITLGDGYFSSVEFFCEGLEDSSVRQQAQQRNAGGGPDSGGGSPIVEQSTLAVAGKGSGEGTPASTAAAAAEFSAELTKAMESVQADMLLLLDDTDPTLLSESFLSKQVGRVLVTHSSLLPAYPGSNPIEAALRDQVCVTGCTVCFATPRGNVAGRRCDGPQILQEAVSVLPTDTPATLRTRLTAEIHSAALPRAIQLVASGFVVLKPTGGGAYRVGRNASSCEVHTEGVAPATRGALAPSFGTPTL